MTDAVADAPDPPAKSKKLPLILGLILAIAGAGGGFYVTASGLLFGQDSTDAHGEHDAPTEHTVEPLPDIGFVEIEPITISLSGSKYVRHLRFRSQLEVNATYREDVELILPRIVDVMNSYLRALDVAEFENPMALARLRAQMLRRVQVVAGQGRIRDLLVMEFVLN